MKFSNKILFLILAIIILVLGYFVGTIILISIFIIVFLMSLSFIVSWIFKFIGTFTDNKYLNIIIKFIFVSSITLLLFALFWNLLSDKLLLLNYYYLLIIIWVFNTIIFSNLWILLKFKSKTKYNKLQDLYIINNNYTSKVTFRDILFISIIPLIITIVFNYLYLINLI